MADSYTVLLKEDVLKNINKENNDIKNLIKIYLKKIEILGPYAGKIISNKYSLFEIKLKRPPLRIYYQINQKEVWILEYEMKTSSKKQKETINKLKKKLS